MAERASWLYWDTSVFLSYFNKNPARHAEIDAVLSAAAQNTGLRGAEITATIQSGLRAGRNQ